RREADEVDEDDADDPPLLAEGRFHVEDSPAREAEARNLGVVLATRTARGHGRILAAFRLHRNGFAASVVVGLTPDTPTTEGDSGMVRAILGVGALLAAVIALAGCGGGGGGSASATTGAVAGAHHARGAGSFRASVRGFEARLQTSVHAFRSGNLKRAIASGGPILNDCMGVVDTKIGRRAS